MTQFQSTSLQLPAFSNRNSETWGNLCVQYLSSRSSHFFQASHRGLLWFVCSWHLEDHLHSHQAGCICFSEIKIQASFEAVFSCKRYCSSVGTLHRNALQFVFSPLISILSFLERKAGLWFWVRFLHPTERKLFKPKGSYSAVTNTNQV